MKNSFRILIVDDSIHFNNSLFESLIQTGQECSQAFTLDEAKKCLASKEFDLVVLDLNLPDGDGDELLYAHATDSSIKFAIYTSDENLHKRAYYFKDGIVDYVLKNYDSNFNANQINNLLIKLRGNKNKSILISDTSTNTREDLKKIFEIRNYLVLTAKNSEETLIILNHYDPSIFIIGLELEDLKGSNLISEIRSKQRFKHTPIIAISQNNTPEILRFAYNSGASDLLKKPITFEELSLKVELWLRVINTEHDLNEKNKQITQYKNILNGDIIITRTNKFGIITYANEAFLNISGFSIDKVLRKSHNIVRHPENSSNFYKEIWDTISSGKIWQGVIKNISSYGKTYYVESIIFPIKNNQDEIIEYMAIRHDITAIMENNNIN